MAHKKEIHISDIRQFRSCRRRWGWASPLQQNLEPVVPYLPFFTGRAVHAALEYYYQEGISFDESIDRYLLAEADNIEKLGPLWPQEELSFAEQIDLIRQILRHYDEWQRQDTKLYADRNLEFITMEMPFEIPMPRPEGAPDLGATLSGRFDGVVRHRTTGEYWIWETKTTRSTNELVRSLANDEQCSLYVYAASQMLQVPIVGVLYNIIRKRAPADPPMLKSGLLSQARNIDTTAFHYLANIKQEYPDWEYETILSMFGDILAHLIQNEQKYFLRFPVYRTKTELDMLLKNVYWTAKEMLDPATVLYPAPTWLNCNFCPFRGPCLTMNAGGDFGVLLEAEFQTRESATSMRPTTPEE